MGGPIGSVEFDYTGPPVTVSNSMAMDLVDQFGMQNAWHAFLKLRGMNLTKDEAEKVLPVKRFRNKVRRLKQTIGTLKDRSDDASTFLAKEFSISFEAAKQSNNNKEATAEGSETDGSAEEATTKVESELKANGAEGAASDDEDVPALVIADASEEPDSASKPKEPAQKTKSDSASEPAELASPGLAQDSPIPSVSAASSVSPKKKTSEETIDDAVSSVMRKVKNNEPFEGELSAAKDGSASQKQPKKMFRNLHKSDKTKPTSEQRATAEAIATSPIGIAALQSLHLDTINASATTKSATNASARPKSTGRSKPSAHVLGVKQSPSPSKGAAAAGGAVPLGASGIVGNEMLLSVLGASPSASAPVLCTNLPGQRLPAASKLGGPSVVAPSLNPTALAAAFASGQVPFALPMPGIIANFPALYASQQGTVLGDSATVASLLRNLHVQQQFQQPTSHAASTVTVTEIPTSPKPSATASGEKTKEPAASGSAKKSTPEKRKKHDLKDNQMPGPSKAEDIKADESKEAEPDAKGPAKKTKPSADVNSESSPTPSPNKKQAKKLATAVDKKHAELVTKVASLEEEVTKLKKQLQTEKTKTNAQRRRADQLQEELQQKLNAVQVAQVDLICQQKDSEKLLQEIDQLKTENRKLTTALNEAHEESPKTSSSRATRSRPDRDSSTSSKAIPSKVSPSQGVSTRKRAAAETKQEPEPEPEPEPEVRRKSTRLCAVRSKFLCSMY